MTPISFALLILLDCETLEQAQKACRKYIKELEKTQAAPRIHTSGYMNIPNLAQAPSTQRLLDAQIQTSAPTLPPVIRNPGAEINNGDGTKGKRKW